MMIDRVMIDRANTFLGELWAARDEMSSCHACLIALVEDAQRKTDAIEHAEDTVAGAIGSIGCAINEVDAMVKVLAAVDAALMAPADGEKGMSVEQRVLASRSESAAYATT